MKQLSTRFAANVFRQIVELYLQSGSIVITNNHVMQLIFMYLIRSNINNYHTLSQCKDMLNLGTNWNDEAQIEVLEIMFKVRELN